MAMPGEDWALTPVDRHPAALAWMASRPGRSAPDRVVPLKEGSKTGVYRLEGPGSSATFIAQRMRRRRWQLERALYEDVFPRLPVPTLQYYGSLEGAAGDDGWLFLEDAGEERLSFDVAEHRALAVRWLGLLHTATARATWHAQLPDRGPDEYLGRARAVQRELGVLRHSDLAAMGGAPAILDALTQTIEILLIRWDELTGPCARVPPAIVHRDFQEKNLRVSRGRGGLRLLAFDWATAGAGSPAADLGGRLFTAAGRPGAAGRDAYLSLVRESWPQVSRDDIHRLVCVGRVFRLVAMIEWECRCRRSLQTLRKYASSLQARLRERGWRS